MPIVWKSGSLNLLVPSGPVLDCIGMIPKCHVWEPKQRTKNILQNTLTVKNRRILATNQFRNLYFPAEYLKLERVKYETVTLVPPILYGCKIWRLSKDPEI